MIRLLALLFILLLPACNMPSPGFRGVTATRVTVDGSTFDVRVKDDNAEAMRVNMQYAPRFGVMQTRAATAMAQVSGCEVRTVTGDQALAFGKLKCKGTRKAPPPTTTIALDCEPVRGSGIKEIGQVRIDIECDPA